MDVLLLVSMLLICGGIGLPIALLLPARFAWRMLVAPTLGLAVLSVAAPVAYQWGVTIPMFFIGACALAAIGLALRARCALGSLIASSREHPRVIALAAGGWLAATIAMLVPRWIGGDQFSVFQGNMWDSYGYLQSAVVYARKPYSIVKYATDQQLLQHPLYAIAQQQLLERPSVQLLYAAFSRIAPGQAYRLYYPYLVGLFSQLVLVGMFVVRGLLPRAAPITWIAMAAVFPLGFWGQYVFDINAWSQIASSGGLLLMFALVLHATVLPDPPGAPLRDAWRLAAVLGVGVAGSVYLYPEGFIIYAAALAPVAASVPLYRMVRARQLLLRPLVPLVGMAGAATAVLFSPILHHLVRQLTSNPIVNAPWWRYFQAFFYGRDGVWNSPIDFIAGLFGMYFATPHAHTPLALKLVERFSIAMTATALVVAVAMLASARIEGRGDRSLSNESRALLRAWIAAALMLLLPAVYLVARGSYWPAGKVVSYAAPVFMIVLSTPIVCGIAHRTLRPLRWIAVAFVAFQLGLGVVRIVAARDPDGIHYAAPYPAITVPRFKREYAWDLEALETLLTPDTHVLLAPMDPWPEGHLMVFLYSRGVPFMKSGPVNTYFGAGRDLGTMSPGKVDVEISAEPYGFALQFRDGRPTIRVVSR